MADVTSKLKKRVQKATEARDNAKIDLGAAIDAYGAAEREVASALAELENAETLEMAKELRSQKSG